MSPVVRTLIRIACLPVFAWLIFVGYGQALRILSVAISTSPGSARTQVYASLLAQGFLSAALIALLFSYPLAFVYRHNAFVVALFMTLPVLWFRLPEVMDASRNPVATAISAYELAAFVLLLVAGAALAHRRLSRLRERRDSAASE